MQGRNSTQPSGSSAHLLPLIAVTCSVISLLLLFSSGFGARLGLWPFRTGFSLLKFAAYSGLGCALLSLISTVFSVNRRRLGWVLLSLVALICALLAFGVPYSWKLKAQSYPRIHDISTDLHNPPKFVAVAALRKDPVPYGGALVGAQQLRAYPDLKTLVLPVPKDQAFQLALETARQMGWQIVASEPAEGRIEATDTTRWFGFKDDIVIRITPADGRSLLDMRSVSRVGISDVGTNAKRIRTFLDKISHRNS
jgi:uncharacterized protein (DUF1499 family)